SSYLIFFFSSRRRHTRSKRDWSSDVCSSDLRLFFISDKNGIPNIYQMKLSDRTTIPLTNLQTGVEQMTVSADGSRMVVNSINKGRLDIYMIRSPELRKKEHALEDNQWAKRRANETIGERVPAV